jgi:hypothetical protein
MSGVSVETLPEANHVVSPLPETYIQTGQANRSEERFKEAGSGCRGPALLSDESAIGFGTTITLGLPLSPEVEAGSLRAARAPQQDRVKARPKQLPTQENLPAGISVRRQPFRTFQ